MFEKTTWKIIGQINEQEQWIYQSIDENQIKVNNSMRYGRHKQPPSSITTFFSYQTMSSFIKLYTHKKISCLREFNAQIS